MSNRWHQEAGTRSWQERVFEVIFEADTTAGKIFDVALICVICVSIVAVMLESVASIEAEWGGELRILEWVVTATFTIEYLLRLAVVRKPWGYAKSFFGVLDLISILPTYLSLILPGSQTLLVVRSLRLLRVMRIFKLAEYLGQANLLLDSLQASRRKIFVFLATVLLLDLILGSIMYLLEGGESGFTSIPRSVYWAIVTMTTVGYGDIAPVTVLGQFFAAVVMLLGYAIIAVPTGIVTAEIVDHLRLPPEVTTRSCPACVSEGHILSARFCRDCGEPLDAQDAPDDPT